MKMNIFFASAEIMERPAKIASALRSQGHNVFLMYLSEPADSSLKHCFDNTCKVANTVDVDFIIEKLNVNFIHIFSRDHDPLAMYIVSSKKCKSIYDYKDIFEGLVNIPFPKTTYANQEYLITNSDYICNRDFQINIYQKKKGLKNLKKLYYPDLVWDSQPRVVDLNLNAKNNLYPIKLVLIGNFTIEKVNPEWSGCGFIKILETLLAQDFDVSIYPNSPESADENFFSDYIALSKKYSNFHIMTPIPPDALHQELAKYDYGLQLMQAHHFRDAKKYTEDSVERSATATRCMDYLGAGLPIIYSSCFRLTNLINTRYQIGVCVDGSGLNNLKNILDNVNYSNLKRNVILCSIYTLNSRRWVGKLIKFYKNL